MAEAEFTHAPVMLAEVIEAMQVRPEGVYLDGTFGRGGHARQLLARCGEMLPAQGEQLLELRSIDRGQQIRVLGKQLG